MNENPPPFPDRNYTTTIFEEQIIKSEANNTKGVAKDIVAHLDKLYRKHLLPNWEFERKLAQAAVEAGLDDSLESSAALLQYENSMVDVPFPTLESLPGYPARKKAKEEQEKALKLAEAQARRSARPRSRLEEIREERQDRKFRAAALKFQSPWEGIEGGDFFSRPAKEQQRTLEIFSKLLAKPKAGPGARTGPETNPGLTPVGQLTPIGQPASAALPIAQPLSDPKTPTGAAKTEPALTPETGTPATASRLFLSENAFERARIAGKPVADMFLPSPSAPARCLAGLPLSWALAQATKSCVQWGTRTASCQKKSLHHARGCALLWKPYGGKFRRNAWPGSIKPLLTLIRTPWFTMRGGRWWNTKSHCRGRSMPRLLARTRRITG